VLAVFGVVVGAAWWLSALILATAAALLWVSDPHGVGEIIVAAAFAAAACCTSVLAPAGLLAFRVKRLLDDPKNGFGVCSGLTQRGEPHAGVVDWLHTAIQRTAGLPEDGKPLTFGQLKQFGVALELVTTNLNAGMPVVWPQHADDARWYFDPLEFRRILPLPVVCHMDGRPDTAGRVPLPRDDLPVLVALRMSLAFPVLFSAVPLHSAEGVRTWFSDGGACSNFPVHLFDAWAPRRPTFGLDIAPWPVNRPAGAQLVRLGVRPEARWTFVGDLMTFLRQIADAAQIWRDSAQAALPGYRDRMCQIDLLQGEGGINLGMTVKTIEALIARGHDAGRAIVDGFDEDAHRLARHRLLMRLLQQNLTGMDHACIALLPPREADAAHVLIDFAAAWREDADFTRPPDPRPPATMQIRPR
jgi:hypothetical protein